MKYFLDTEFIERPGRIDLISIGIVSEDNRELYAINKECPWEQASDWVKIHVLSQLPQIKTEYYSLGPGVRGVGIREVHVPSEYRYMSQIRQDILDFIGDDIPEFWGYYADYDWVVFCWIFGQ